MKPAFSVVFFTVASGAGLGLLALIGLADLAGGLSLSEVGMLRGAMLGFALVVAGLSSSTLHLANPKNAWRSASRFRTSWLSREAVFAIALLAAAFAYIALLATGRGGLLRAAIAVALVLLAWAVLLCTAMIYASLKPIRQWHTPATPVNYFLLGHWSGAVLLLGVAGHYASTTRPFAALAAAAGVAALAAKLWYWRITGSSAGSVTLERAIGVEHGVGPPRARQRSGSVMRARLLDSGHTHGTFLTDEFGFSMAREHARGLRLLAVGGGFALPLTWIAFGLFDWRGALGAALACIIGILAERWLFFAEARHTVRLFHGDAQT